MNVYKLMSFLLFMAHLAEYVARINQQHDLNSIQVKCLTDSTVVENDQALQMYKSVKIFEFSDGTRLQQIIENDSEAMRIEACRESWIAYQVIDNSNPMIQPQKIHFDNHCREKHWIQYFLRSNN